jgi:hypothetical protein
MDIRCTEAKQLTQAFIDGHMKMDAGRLTDMARRLRFCRTNKGRIIRYDLNIDQFNVLAPDRRSFIPVRDLPVDEHAVYNRPFERADLLPERTLWERVRGDIAPTLAMAVCFMGVGALTQQILVAINPIGYLRRHLPTSPMPMAAHLPGGQLLRTMHSTEPGAFTTSMHYDAEDGLMGDARLDAHAAWCEQNPEMCAVERMAFVQGSVIGGAFGAAAGVMYANMRKGEYR